MKAFIDIVGVSDNERKSITKVANEKTRHVFRGEPASRPTVSSTDFEKARAVLQKALENYMHYLINHKA